jgi:hypothetical protein
MLRLCCLFLKRGRIPFCKLGGIVVLQRITLHSIPMAIAQIVTIVWGSAFRAILRNPQMVFLLPLVRAALLYMGNVRVHLAKDLCRFCFARLHWRHRQILQIRMVRRDLLE